MAPPWSRTVEGLGEEDSSVIAAMVTRCCPPLVPRATAWVLAGCLAAVMLLSWAVPAAALPAMPPVQHFVPDIDVYPQQFAVAEGPDGVIHVGGADGLLSFDGERWALMPMPNGRLVRSLAHDGDRRLYVGGYGLFGYVEPDDSGALAFTDLSRRLAVDLAGEPFADIWNILISSEGVFFRAVQHVFRYQPHAGNAADGGLQMWRHEGRFGALVEHGGKVILQFRGQGLATFDGDGFEWLPGSESLTEQLYALLPLPDGSLLGLGRDGRWPVWREGRVEMRPMPAALGSSAQFASTVAMASGELVFGRSDGTLHVFTPGRVPAEDQLNSFRLATDRIDAVSVARGGFLAQTDLATIHVRWPSAWQRVDSGAAGTIKAVAFWKGEWLTFGGAGVAALRDGPEVVDRAAGFRRKDWTDFEAWDWLLVDPDRALLATSYAVMEVTPEGAREITHGAVYPRRFLASRYHEGRIYVGTELGIAVLQAGTKDWTLLHASAAYRARVLSLVELSPDTLLLGTDDDGLLLLRVDAVSGAALEWRELDESTGILHGSRRSARVLAEADGKVLVSTTGGLFQFRDGELHEDDFAGLASLRDDDEQLELLLAANGDRWAFSYRRLFRQEVGGSWRKQDIEALRSGALNAVTVVDDGTVYVGMSSALLRHRSNGEVAMPSPQLRLRSVKQRLRDGGERRLAIMGSLSPQLAAADATLIFEYALPARQRPEQVVYQARLAGYEDAFSAWGQATRITYSRLRPGTYRFEARARDATGLISSAEPFVFDVVPPWYRSPAAMVAWSVLALLLLALLLMVLLRWRVRRLEAERLRLTEMVARRTRELAQANHQLQAMAHQDGLTGIANRRRLDLYLDEAAALCREEQRPLAVLLIDVDYFKRYNDLHGHLAADSVLRELAALLAGGLRRAEDLAARYGGEEFCIIMPGVGRDMAAEMAESIRQRILESGLGITVSMGVASRVPAAGDNGHALIEQADRALYEAKGAGRNQVRVAADA